MTKYKVKAVQVLDQHIIEIDSYAEGKVGLQGDRDKVERIVLCCFISNAISKISHSQPQILNPIVYY
jgi:hypothetical protein